MTTCDQFTRATGADLSISSHNTIWLRGEEPWPHPPAHINKACELRRLNYAILHCSMTTRGCIRVLLTEGVLELFPLEPTFRKKGHQRQKKCLD